MYLYKSILIVFVIMQRSNGFINKNIITRGSRLFGTRKENRKSKLEITTNSAFYKAKTENQKIYTEYLKDAKTKIVFAIGPAGTGKTLLACNNGISEMKNGKYNKIVITRPVVPVEEDLGFLPGSLVKKMDPWTRPIFDIFLEFYSQREIDEMMKNNIIEISPLAYMRGRTFKNAYIIADEMQNSSPNQMLMLTTRIGVGSKMVITGDLKQTDRGLQSGLSDFITKYNSYKNGIIIDSNSEKMGIEVIKFDNSDIKRDPIVAKILDIYNGYDICNKKMQITNSEKKIEIENDAALFPKNIISKDKI